VLHGTGYRKKEGQEKGLATSGEFIETKTQLKHAYSNLVLLLVNLLLQQQQVDFGLVRRM